MVSERIDQVQGEISMTITARIIADSISEHSPRLTTLQLRYPKFIHGEAKTHRVMRIADRAYESLQEIGFLDDPNLSRNSSSSRAIPVARLIQDVMDDPVIPMHWGANQKGMQAIAECNELVHIGGMWFNDSGNLMADDTTRVRAWLLGRDYMVRLARAFDEAGYHKQIVNRLIEPWCHINTIVTATEWSNFFALRCHPDAQPEMRALADAIFLAMANSTPQYLNPTDWHLPFVRDDEKHTVWLEHRYVGRDNSEEWDWDSANKQLIKLSVARCARTSYMTHDGKEPNIDDDLKLYERLVGSVPLHASPAEHQASPDFPSVYKDQWCNPHLHANFVGWCQYRKTLVGENQ